MNGALTSKAGDILKTSPMFKAEYALYNTIELMYYRMLADTGLLQATIDSTRANPFA